MVKLTAQAAGTPWPVRLGERLTAFGNLSLALLLALLVFLLPLFLACRMILRGKNADVRVYGGLGSLVLIGAVALSSYFLFSRVPLRATCSAIRSAIF